MKIVVIGGNGRIGSRIVEVAVAWGHDVVAASRRNGVDTVTGKGLAAALAGADVVIDASNSPSPEGPAALAFFETSTANLLRAEADASVRHHVLLSIVGIDHDTGSGYFDAKLAQEQLVVTGSIPYTIVRATQFFEFIADLAGWSIVGDRVVLPETAFQPVAATDVAMLLIRIAEGDPRRGITELAGPERSSLVEMVGRVLRTAADPRQVVAEPGAEMFGARLDPLALVPDGEAELGETRLDDWLVERSR